MLQSRHTEGTDIFSALGGTKGKLIEHLLGSGGVLGQEEDLWAAASYRKLVLEWLGHTGVKVRHVLKTSGHLGH